MILQIIITQQANYNFLSEKQFLFLNTHTPILWNNISMCKFINNNFYDAHRLLQLKKFQISTQQTMKKFFLTISQHVINSGKN